MGKLMLALKGKLGFCQSKGCWKRSMCEMKIPGIKIKRNLCEEHMQKVMENSTLKEITMEVERTK